LSFPIIYKYLSYLSNRCVKCKIRIHYQTRQKDHSFTLGYLDTSSPVIYLIEVVPYTIIDSFNYLIIISKARFKPSAPLNKLNIKPWPIKTKSAPNAKHLNTSPPDFIPPSTKIYIFDFNSKLDRFTFDFLANFRQN
jgi:hypothetical protein